MICRSNSTYWTVRLNRPVNFDSKVGENLSAAKVKLENYEAGKKLSKLQVKQSILVLHLLYVLSAWLLSYEPKAAAAL